MRDEPCIFHKRDIAVERMLRAIEINMRNSHQARYQQHKLVYLT